MCLDKASFIIRQALHTPRIFHHPLSTSRDSANTRNFSILKMKMNIVSLLFKRLFIAEDRMHHFGTDCVHALDAKIISMARVQNYGPLLWCFKISIPLSFFSYVSFATMLITENENSVQ